MCHAICNLGMTYENIVIGQSRNKEHIPFKGHGLEKKRLRVDKFIPSKSLPGSVLQRRDLSVTTPHLLDYLPSSSFNV